MSDSFSFTLDTRPLKKGLDRFAKTQLPFATALALTRTAQDIQSDVRDIMEKRLTIRKKWSLTSIKILKANKRDGLDRMNAIIGSRDWYMVDQFESESSIRTPAKAKYRFIPVNARKSKRANISPTLRPNRVFDRKGVFLAKAKDGSPLVMERKRKKVSVLYKLVPEQTIDPKIDFAAVVESSADRHFVNNYRQALKRAMATAR